MRRGDRLGAPTPSREALMKRWLRHVLPLLLVALYFHQTTEGPLDRLPRPDFLVQAVLTPYESVTQYRTTAPFVIAIVRSTMLLAVVLARSI